MRVVVEGERAHPEPLLGERCSLVELVISNIADDFIHGGTRMLV